MRRARIVLLAAFAAVAAPAQAPETKVARIGWIGAAGAAAVRPNLDAFRAGLAERGIARGFATLGQVGFDARSDYAAICTVSNLAARLSDEAGQILVSQRVAAVVEQIAETAFVGDQPLKGFARSVPTYELLRCLPVASKIDQHGFV